MKHYYFFFFALLYTTFTKAQQWIDKTYAYDSIPNVVYGAATNFNAGVDSLKMDIYLPKCNTTTVNSRKPLMLVIHGGSFLAGTRYDPNITKLTKDFAKRGYVTATIEYRLGFVSDDQAWACNLANYPCVFATDTTEWYRSWYRGVQDAKGALRYLINRNMQYNIDTNNVFIVGESAGAFLALGVGYLDTIAERPIQTYSLVNAPIPSANTFTCSYNAGKTFTTAIIRPDLGGIDGIIEPSTINYKIKGVGSFYGGVVNNLFLKTKTGAIPPALYLYHQPCDMVVPYGIGKVNAGTSWCVSNCYNCYGFANTPFVSGGGAIKNSITSASLSIAVYSDFTSNINPNNCLFGSWSCADQINSPCHEIDNYTMRTSNMATFFASKITTNPLCLPLITLSDDFEKLNQSIFVYPNPFNNEFVVDNKLNKLLPYEVVDVLGKVIAIGFLTPDENKLSIAKQLDAGLYFLKIKEKNNQLILSIIKTNDY